MVPPENISLDTAIFVLETRDYRLSDVKEIDSYGDVEMKGKVAVLKRSMVLFSSTSTKAKKRRRSEEIERQSRVCFHKKCSGPAQHGKILHSIGWKEDHCLVEKNWLFVVEGKNGVEEFVKHVYRVYEEMKR